MTYLCFLQRSNYLVCMPSMLLHFFNSFCVLLSCVFLHFFSFADSVNEGNLEEFTGQLFVLRLWADWLVCSWTRFFSRSFVLINLLQMIHWMARFCIHQLELQSPIIITFIRLMRRGTAKSLWMTAVVSLNLI